MVSLIDRSVAEQLTCPDRGSNCDCRGGCEFYSLYCVIQVTGVRAWDESAAYASGSAQKRFSASHASAWRFVGRWVGHRF